jgi:WD40 repeat protein
MSLATLQRTSSLVLSALLLLCAGCVSSIFLFAEGTRIWEQSKFEDLSKGTSTGVAISRRGGIELAPSFKALSTTPASYIWAIAADRDGTMYAATGAPARIYRITPDGHSTAIFQPAELQVQSLVVDKQGVILAATNPDGKVYRIEHTNKSTAEISETSTSMSGWASSVFFDPHRKYIWKLVLDSADNIYVATGDRGEIFRVTPKGEQSLFFKSDEAQIRTMDFDASGNLIAGSNGSGLVYRISSSGEGFVLYSAPKKEITALAVDKDGNIYAAGVGDKRSGGSANPSSSSIESPSSSGSSSTAQPPPGAALTNPAATSAPAISNFSGSGVSASGGSEIYKISPEGSPTRLWASHDDIVYALAFDPQGRLLAGTGNRGRIFAIAGEDDYTDLLRTSATQVTAFAKAPAGGLIAATSNLGKVFVMGVSQESTGSYESDVFDAHIFSKWGRAEVRSQGNVELFIRSGNVDNPDRNWSPWKKEDAQKENEVVAPAARFVQWKAVLHSGNPQPRLNRVTLNYLPKNVAPDFEDVTVQAGVRYQPVSRSVLSDAGGGAQRSDNPPPSTHDRDSIGVRWSVHDDNDDQMVYSVYYRGDGETRWQLLKSDLTDKFFSFDAALLPDGGYTIKVVASDEPSHPSREALSSERESVRFEVDTTPPRIEDLKAVKEGQSVHVTFRAADTFSPLKRAEFSVDAGSWQFVEPTGGLSDSRNESYDFRAAIENQIGSQAGSLSSDTSRNAGDTELIVVVRVYDRYDNMASAKVVVHGR